MKSFDDFLSTITEEEMYELAEEHTAQLPDDPATALCVIPVRMFTSILRRYHQWLMDQLP